MLVGNSLLVSIQGSQMTNLVRYAGIRALEHVMPKSKTTLAQPKQPSHVMLSNRILKEMSARAQPVWNDIESTLVRMRASYETTFAKSNDSCDHSTAKLPTVYLHLP